MDVSKLSCSFIFILLNGGLFTVECQQQNGMEDADAYLTTPQLNAKYGYNAEIHSVVTVDGYILEMHRINGLKNPSWFDKLKRRPAVLLMHGMTADSSNWSLFGLQRGLAYQLANAGFDVWCGNVRGNEYSKTHKTLLPSQKEYWNFSFHEMGYYDLPAMIDYILLHTQQTQLNYIGHSQGGTIFYVMCASRPEYNSKISLFQGLAPSAFCATSAFQIFIAQFMGVADVFSNLLGIGMVPVKPLPQVKNDTIQYLLANKGTQSNANIAASYSQSLGGPIEADMLPIIYGHLGNDIAYRQLSHYAQLIQSGRFHYFDYGPWKNKELYGTFTAPDYGASKITVPSILLSGTLDNLVPADQIKKFSVLLPNLVEYREIPQFTHLDFIVNQQIRMKLNNDVVANAVKYKTCQYCFI